MPELNRILLVDDSAGDTELVLNALQHHHLANGVDTVRDGAAALDYLYCRGVFGGRPAGNPIVVMLDLKMPKVDGLEVLRQIKADPMLRAIPIVVMTSSKQDRDVIDSYDLGVNAYVVKPVNFQEFTEAIKLVGKFWGVLNEPPPAGLFNEASPRTGVSR